MSTTYKTYGGLVKATRALIEELGGSAIDNDHDYRAYSKRVDNLHRQLDALWTNPADVSETARLRHELSDAWNAATASV